jgi:hypothetical protein
MATGRKRKTKATAAERKLDSLRWSTSPMRHVPGFIQSTKKFISGIGFPYRPEFKDGANAIAPPQSPNRSAGSADGKGLAIRLALADR